MRREAGKSTFRAEPDSTASPRGERTARVTRLPRKSAKDITAVPVPQTDTGGWIEYIKALE